VTYRRKHIENISNIALESALSSDTDVVLVGVDLIDAVGIIELIHF
jgi:hypothetical protein